MKKKTEKKEIEIIKDQDTNDFGNLVVGQKLTINKKKADLLINRGIGSEELTNRAAGDSPGVKDD